MTEIPFSAPGFVAVIVNVPAGRIAAKAPLASEVRSSSAVDWMAIEADVRAPCGSVVTPEIWKPFDRGMSRANDAACGIVIRAKNAELPTDRDAYAS